MTPVAVHSTGLSILVVDDEKSVRNSLIRMLSAHGHRATGASDGSEAVKKAIGERPDVIFMDLLMPVQNGIETTRQLRKEPETNQIPVIALSASPIRSDESLLFQLVLANPCSLADLLNAIDTVVPDRGAYEAG